MIRSEKYNIENADIIYYVYIVYTDLHQYTTN